MDINDNLTLAINTEWAVPRLRFKTNGKVLGFWAYGFHTAAGEEWIPYGIYPEDPYEQTDPYER